MILENGTFLADRYEIIEKIGAGGMSDVYKAKDHSLDRIVAIKVLKDEFAEDAGFVTKFRQEAQSAAGLEHPNIVNIYDVGSEGGLYYIVMEYVEGVTLKTYISKKGPLSYKEVLSIAIQAGRGIEAAHRKNIVHRDIKPQNIIISNEGKVKVTDFGIARAATSNTINADIMGSVHYSSPEQARNGFVSFPSDIYSLGIVMYEMCTGRVPYDGDTTVSIAIQHLQGTMTPPSEYVPDLPIAVERIIQKATMKSQERRYSSMSDMLTDMKKALSNPYEDFVTIADPDENDKTQVMTQEELEKIRENAGEEELADEEEDDGKPTNPKMEKIITIVGIAAGIVIIAIIVYLIGSALGLFHIGSSDSSKSDTTTEETEQVKVPNLLGMTEDEAKAALKKVGLGYKNSGTASSDKYDEGQVCSQSVNAGTEVSKNTTIKVTISSGKGSVSIPNVIGKDEASALSTLSSAGFKYSKSYQYSDTVASGLVISQTPDASTSGKEGDTIALVISQGKEQVQVPDVIGKSQSDAESTLSANGLTVSSVTQDYSDSVSAGCVISQGISAGSYVDSGSGVSLVVSRGPQASTYAFSQTLSAVNSETTVYVLKDGNGSTVGTWTIDPSSGTSSIQANANGISTSTGTLTATVDGTQYSSRSVQFTKE